MVTEENPIRESPIAGPGAGEAGERFAKGETSAQGGFPSPEHKKEKEDPFRRSRKGKKKNRLTTDAVREVRFTFSRFLSILVLSALAVAFLAGLRTTAPDMEYTADNYYDRTHLMDGYAISTLGLTGDDLAALAQADGVSAVEGSWTLDATAEDAVVAVRSMPETLNLLEVTEGRLPQAAGECVTESMLLTKLDLAVGDTLELVGPDVRPQTLTVEGLWDEAGESLDQVRKPQMVFRMKLPQPVPPLSLLRRQAELTP